MLIAHGFEDNSATNWATVLSGLIAPKTIVHALQVVSTRQAST